MRRATALTMVVLTSAPCQGAAQELLHPLDRQVTTNLILPMPAGSCTFPNIAATIAKQLDIPSGIEKVPGPCTPPPKLPDKEIPLIGMAFLDVLDLLQQVDSRYYWAYSDGVVVVRPLEAWGKKDHFLHEILPGLELEKQNIGAALDRIIRRPDLNNGSGELIMSADPSAISLSLGPISIIEALDAVVREHGRARWEVTYCIPEVAPDVARVFLYTYDVRGIGRPGGPPPKDAAGKSVHRCMPPQQ